MHIFRTKPADFCLWGQSLDSQRMLWDCSGWQWWCWLVCCAGPVSFEASHCMWLTHYIISFTQYIVLMMTLPHRWLQRWLLGLWIQGLLLFPPLLLLIHSNHSLSGFLVSLLMWLLVHVMYHIHLAIKSSRHSLPVILLKAWLVKGLGQSKNQPELT